MSRIFLMGVGALVLTVLGGCSEKAASPGNVLHGNVDDRELKLAFVLSERLSSVLPEEGTSVKKGDLMATLETVRIENDVAVARAAGAVREAQLAVAQALLEKSANGSRAEDVAMVTAGTQAIEAKIKAVRLAFERNRTLVKTRAVPQQTADDFEAEFFSSRMRSVPPRTTWPSSSRATAPKTVRPHGRAWRRPKAPFCRPRRSWPLRNSGSGTRNSMRRRTASCANVCSNRAR